MNRRDAIARVSLLLGGTILGVEAFLSGCHNAPEKKIAGGGTNFTNDDIAYFDEIAETILPATDTPGAKDAKVGEFMARERLLYGKGPEGLFGRHAGVE